MKPFSFYIKPFEIPLGFEKQKALVFALHDELMAKVDDRIAWAKGRSQSEAWWDLETRSCSEHYKLIDTFDCEAQRLRDSISWPLLSALWSRVHRHRWSITKYHLNKANKPVRAINQLFRPTRQS